MTPLLLLYLTPPQHALRMLPPSPHAAAVSAAAPASFPTHPPPFDNNNDNDNDNNNDNKYIKYGMLDNIKRPWQLAPDWDLLSR